MTIKIKPLMYIFIAVLILFTLIGVIINQTYLPIKQNKIFEKLQNSVVNIPEDVNKKQQEIYFTVDEETNLPKAVQELNKVIEETDYVDYKLVVNRENESEELKEVWQQLQFNLYEIIGQKKFTQLTTLPLQFSKQYPGVNFSVSMDEQYVYVTLDNEQNQLYRMLPVNETYVGTWG